MSIRKRDVHFSDWTKVRHALVCNNVQGITETSSLDEVRAFLINSESGSNPFYYYVCYIKETNEIYTHGTFYNCTGYNDSDIRDLIQSVEDSFVEQITALQNEVEENEKVTTMALYDLNDRKANKDDLQNINLDKYVDWDSLYSETNSLYSSLQSSINSNYTTLNNNKADKTDLEALSAEVEENEEVTAAALTELHENKADKSEIPDVSTLATKDDINLKQDVLSASDFATINGASVFGGDNVIVIEEPDHYASGTSTVDGSGFVTSVTTNEAGHVTKVSARAITDNDITSISASKITGTINIDNLPTGALERMFVVEDETAAMSATVEEGDVVQITGNGNKMYFCVRSGATIFSEKFMEFTAGTATSVAWSGVTGKPEGIDGWGDRISTVEADYFSRTGGTITGEVTVSCAANTPLKINSNATDSGIYFNLNGASKTWIGYETSRGSVMYHSDGSHRLGINNDGVAFYDSNTLLHSGNYSEYAVKKNVFINTAIADNEYGYGYVDGGWPEAGPAMVFGAGNHKAGIQVGALGSAIRYGYTAGTTSFTWRTILDENNYSDYALPLTGGTVNGRITVKGYDHFVAEGDSYKLVFGIGSGQVNRGIYDSTNNHWWIYRSSTTDTYIPNGNVAIGGTTAETKLHVHGDAKVSGQIYLGGVLRNANGEWLLGESSANGGVFVGTSSYAQERAFVNYHGKLSLTAEGGVEAQLTYLNGNPTLGQLDTKGVLRLTSTAGFGLYSWVRNTGNSYIQVGTDSRYVSTPATANLVLQALGGNVAIGDTTADEKLHVHGKMVVSGNIKIPGSSDGRYSLYSDGGIRFYAPSSGG